MFRIGSKYAEKLSKGWYFKWTGISIHWCIDKQEQ